MTFNLIETLASISPPIRLFRGFSSAGKYRTVGRGMGGVEWGGVIASKVSSYQQQVRSTRTFEYQFGMGAQICTDN